jgi:hypothetical protein
MAGRACRCFGRDDPFWYWANLPAILIGYIKRYRIGSSFAGPKREIWPLGDDMAGKTSLDLWIEVMDWSHLHTLDLDSPSDETLAKLDKSLGLEGSHVEGFEDKPRRVKVHFRYRGTTRGAIFSKYGIRIASSCRRNCFRASERLRRLAIHQIEDNYGFDHHLLALNATEISWLFNSCLGIRRLDIDAVRSADWDTDVIRALSSSTLELSHLILHFPSADAFTGRMDYCHVTRKDMTWGDWENLPDPLINKTLVESLFRILRENKLSQELKNLDVYAGNWEYRDLPASMAARDRRRVAWYSCYIQLGKEICIGQQTRNNS